MFVNVLMVESVVVEKDVMCLLMKNIVGIDEVVNIFIFYFIID